MTAGEAADGELRRALRAAHGSGPLVLPALPPLPAICHVRFLHISCLLQF